MTERLYYTDPALLDFAATLIRVTPEKDRWEVVLDRSAFYPTSGGQQADRGTIDGIPVLDVYETDTGEVVQVLTDNPGPVGASVRGLVDAGRRRRHRQQHTAQHILSQVLVQQGKRETVSVHLGEDYGAIETSGEMLSGEELDAVETEANRIVFENLPVTIRFLKKDEVIRLPLRKVPDRDGEIRLIQIGDFDYSACGGTHCLSTSEVGLIKITGTTRQRGNVLITFLAGAQALDDYRLRFRVSEQMANELTCHVSDIPGRLASLSDDLKLARLQLNAAQKELLPVQADRLASDADAKGPHSLVVAPLDGYDPKVAAQLLVAVVERTRGVAVGVLDRRLLVTVNPASDLKANEIVKSICATTGLKGGGSPTAAQVGGMEEDRVGEVMAIVRRLVDHV